MAACSPVWRHLIFLLLTIMHPEYELQVGLTKTQLRLAYSNLLKVEEAIVHKWPAEADQPASDGAERASDIQRDLLSIHALKKSIVRGLSEAMEGPADESMSLSPRSVTWEDLAELNIKFSAILEEFWSSKNLYHHLQSLQLYVNTVTWTTSSSHAWIEALLFPHGLEMTRQITTDKTNLPKNYPSDWVTFSKLVDYTAIVTDRSRAGFCRAYTMFDILKSEGQSGFFIIEANLVPPEEPMFICANFFSKMILSTSRKKVLRAALTNGHEWIFLLIKLNDNYEGATFKQSAKVHLYPAESPWPDVIAGILLHWIENSSEDLDGDDWFRTY
ncbi:hypothetical protein EI94DRAFT_1752402 [Lactarius quietus]|nr:hypothetical protein EI94DRAFT_1752402 [Lactarius quietus]